MNTVQVALLVLNIFVVYRFVRSSRAEAYHGCACRSLPVARPRILQRCVCIAAAGWVP